MPADEVAPLRYGPAVSPLLAAELAGETLDARRLLAAGAAAVGDPRNTDRTLIVEGVGGLLSPLAENLTVCDPGRRVAPAAADRRPPGLGTINHTLLTLQAARAAGLSVRAVVVTPWPQNPSRLELSNRDAITRFGVVEVDTLARASGPQIAELARVGAALPWRRWLGERPRGLALHGRARLWCKHGGEHLGEQRAG